MQFYILGEMRMLTITIEGGETYSMEAHIPMGRVNGEGDNYGNGHIDWNPDGLFLYEIIEKIEEEPKDPVVGAWREGQFLPMNYFVCRDCTLKLETVSDEYGRKMWLETAELLTGYVMQTLYPAFQKINSATPMQLAYVVEQAKETEALDLKDLNEALSKLIDENTVSVETHLINPMKLIRKLEGQGQKNLAYTLYGTDCGEPILVHEMNTGYVAEANINTTLPLEYMRGLKVSSVERQKFQNFMGNTLYLKNK